MKCPNCQHENDPLALFCQNCGHRLNVRCSNCSTLNGVEARFCKNCGNPLPGTASAPDAEVLRPVEPAGRYKTTHSERRVVTILFADIKGSTALAEKLDPEEWTEIMNVTFERMTRAVKRYDGTVARLMGDSILAFFGAPNAHEDDPYRAILASLAMLDDLHPYQEEIRRQMVRKGHHPEATDFEVRIGINTGLVVVGEVGMRPYVEYTAMGDAVNLASRLEQTAAPGTIQISQDTYRLVASLVEVEPLGAVEVKGKSGKFNTFRVIGSKEKRSGLRHFSGLQAPLVGRSAEMGQLLEAVRRLHTGYGQVISLIGEAGLGKSRLIAELRANPALEQFDWFEAASLSFENSQPYGLVKRQLQSVLKLSQEDSTRRIRNKMQAGVAQVPEENREIVIRALETLFIQPGENGQGAPQGEALQRALFEGVRIFWQDHSLDRPVILVFDDLHWADPASVDLILNLLELSEEAPILFLCVYRPDRQSPAWTLKQHIERKYPHRSLEITLHPLSAQDSSDMVNHLLQKSRLPQAVIDPILAKAEGNPFFVEEIVHELIEKGSLEFDEEQSCWFLASEMDTIDIPDSLEALLIARLDRLESETRRTLQLAAVIGRSFYYRVLQMVADQMGQLDHDLQILQQNGLILEAARRPELEYMFRHVLTQEAAYNTILISQRRQFHQQTGEVMERLFADRLKEHAPLLAHHFMRSGDFGRAFRYFSMAAEGAAGLFANLEAILLYNQALDLVPELKDISPEKQIHLLRGRGLAFETQGKFDEALSDLEAVLEIARRQDLQRQQWRGLLDLGVLWASRDYARAGELYQQSLEIARKMDNPAAEGASLNRLGNWMLNVDRPKEAVKHHQEALEIFERLDDEKGLADTLDLLGMANLLGGDAVASKGYYLKAIDLFRKLDNRLGLVSSLTALKYRSPNYQMQTIFTEDTLEKVLAEGEMELEIARKINWRAGESWAAWGIALVYGAHGLYDVAFKRAELGIHIAEEIQHRQWMAGGKTTLGTLYLDVLNFENAIPTLKEALSLALEVDSQNWIKTASGYLAHSYTLEGNLEEAEKVLKPILVPGTPMDSVGQRISWTGMAELRLTQKRYSQALEIADGLIASAQSRPEDGVITRLWLIKARSKIGLGKSGEAERLLLDAIENGQNLGEEPLVWRTYAALGRIYQASGNIPQAVQAFTHSQRIIEKLARRIPDEAVQAHFMKRALAYMEAYE